MGLGGLGFDPNRRTECGDRLIKLPPGLKAAPGCCSEGIFRIDPDHRAVWGNRLFRLTLCYQSDAEVTVGLGERRLIRIAARYAAIASSSVPWPPRATPRLSSASAESGWSRITSR